MKTRSGKEKNDVEILKSSAGLPLGPIGHGPSVSTRFHPFRLFQPSFGRPAAFADSFQDASDTTMTWSLPSVPAEMAFIFLQKRKLKLSISETLALNHQVDVGWADGQILSQILSRFTT